MSDDDVKVIGPPFFDINGEITKIIQQHILNGDLDDLYNAIFINILGEIIGKDEKIFRSKFQKKTSLLHQFENSLWYSIECDCGDRDCGAILEIEVDTTCKLILLHFYKDVYFDYWKYSDPGF